MGSNNINKIIKNVTKEMFPPEVFQKGTSRVYYDDNGYFMTHIEFQPMTIGKGSLLNIGVSFLFEESESLRYHYGYRKGNRFIEYKDDEQFEEDIREYVELANEYIHKYRSFRNLPCAIEHVVKFLDDNGWHPFHKAMLYYLADDKANGDKYYELFMNGSTYKMFGEKYNVPKDPSVINKQSVMQTILTQRAYLRNKPSMKKMKIIEDFEQLESYIDYTVPEQPITIIDDEVSRRYYATHTPITVRGEIEQTDLISEPDYKESKSKCVSKKDLTIQNAKYGILIGLIIYFILSFLGIYN